MDDSLESLETMLTNGYVSPDIREEILRIGYRVKEEFLRYLYEVPISSSRLRKAVLHLAGRGKFVRGIFTYVFARALGVDEDRAVILAVSTELYHLASLIHDDIIDGAGYRRGVETVHRRFGLEYAIIAGDLLIVYSNLLLSRLGCRVISIYAYEGVRLADGEALELDIGGVGDLESYYRVIDLKTSSVFVAMLESCAVLAGMDDMLDRVRELAREVGYAFQIGDDILDVVGNSSVTGKDTGMDVDGINIVNIFLRRGLRPEEAVARARELLRRHVERALSMLRLFRLEEGYTRILTALIRSLEVRRL